MLKITKEDLLSIELARRVVQSTKPVSAFQLAKDLDESVMFVQNLLTKLVSKGLIESKKGPNGGYITKRTELTLGEVIEVRSGNTLLGNYIAGILNSALIIEPLLSSPTYISNVTPEELSLDVLIPNVLAPTL